MSAQIKDAARELSKNESATCQGVVFDEGITYCCREPAKYEERGRFYCERHCPSIIAEERREKGRQNEREIKLAERKHQARLNVQDAEMCLANAVLVLCLEESMPKRIQDCAQDVRAARKKLEELRRCT